MAKKKHAQFPPPSHRLRKSRKARGRYVIDRPIFFSDFGLAGNKFSRYILLLLSYYWRKPYLISATLLCPNQLLLFFYINWMAAKKKILSSHAHRLRSSRTTAKRKAISYEPPYFFPGARVFLVITTARKKIHTGYPESERSYFFKYERFSIFTTAIK